MRNDQHCQRVLYAFDVVWIFSVILCYTARNMLKEKHGAERLYCGLRTWLCCIWVMPYDICNLCCCDKNRPQAKENPLLHWVILLDVKEQVSSEQPASEKPSPEEMA